MIFFPQKKKQLLILFLYLPTKITIQPIKKHKTMSYLITPKGYKPILDLRQTELGIKQIKEFFQLNLSSELRLRRVTAPLFVLKGMGINDDLNGVERPVSSPFRSPSKTWATYRQRSYTRWPNGNGSPWQNTT